MIEYLSSRHNQFTWESCLEMTRPQLFIWFERTAEREQQETIAEQENRWDIASHIIAKIHNTAMGMKKKDMVKPKDCMPDFDEIRKEQESLSNDEYIEMAKNKGLKVPQN